MIPERFFDILRRGADLETGQFPPTEIFNEGWMLRLLLDAVRGLGISDRPLRFLPGADWFSEVRMSSPFRPRHRGDALAEGFTHADAVVGHFEFRPDTRAGLRLSPDCRQFVVIEAKMFSNLSSGTTNARTYHQAARNVACMAQAIAANGRRLDHLGDIGFFVIAPALELRSHRDTNLEACMTPDSIRNAIEERIMSYERALRPETGELRDWQERWFEPVVTRLVGTNKLGVLSWEDCISAIARADPIGGDELRRFYQQCKQLGSIDVTLSRSAGED